jgi:hypothetical protein
MRVAALSCPTFPGNAERINWFMMIDRVMGSDERRLMAFKITRNMIKDRVMKFIRENGTPAAA